MHTICTRWRRHIAVVYAYAYINIQKESPAVLYCIGPPLVAISFKVLKQVQNWRCWRLQRRSGAPVEPEEVLTHAAGSGFDVNKVL